MDKETKYLTQNKILTRVMGVHCIEFKTQKEYSDKQFDEIKNLSEIFTAFKDDERCFYTILKSEYSVEYLKNFIKKIYDLLQ